jgi:large subunit ribosomal protein L34e
MLKTKIRTTTGKIVFREKRKKAGIAKCALCKRPLHGVPNLMRGEIRKWRKTEKRPERPYGGYLCSACSRELFREEARKIKR